MDKNKKLFPQRLWELIHNEEYNFCLRWSQDGQRVYLNRNEFETHYLKSSENQFHTQKAISFVRQMNIYGFRKVDDCYYENDNFKRNCPQLLKNMVRRHSNKGFHTNNNHHHLTTVCNNNQQSSANGNGTNTCTTTTVLNGNNHNNNNNNIIINNNTDQQASIQPLYRRQKVSSVSAEQLNVVHSNQHQVLAQCYRDAAAASGGPLGAALAASMGATGVSRLPLAASTLYHRLAALNFESQAAAAVASTFDSSSSSSPLLPVVGALHEGTGGGAKQVLVGSGQESTESMGNLGAFATFQESQMAQQALQQTLVRSLLQLKQPTQPNSALLLQQNLVASLQQQQQQQQQQHQNPNLLLQSIANLGSPTIKAIPDVQIQSRDDLSSSSSSSTSSSSPPSPSSSSSSPLELVVNHVMSHSLNNNNIINNSSSNLDLQQRQNELTNQWPISRTGARRSSAADFRGLSVINETLQQQQQQRFLHLRAGENHHQFELASDNLMDGTSLDFDHQDQLLTNFTTSSSLRQSSSCSSVEPAKEMQHQLQQQEDLSSLVLNLARPSGERATRALQQEQRQDDQDEDVDDE